MRKILFSLLALAACTHSPSQVAGNQPIARRPAQESTLRPGFISIREIDPNKKTVCSITLNSDNEILTFQRKLSPRDFQFTELVTEESDWLERALTSGVRCDILVVSGHFSGSFYGTAGHLELAELETNSCDRAHSGVFHAPKEIFLFGCNTLAGKTKDSRTPEEYRQVLAQHNYSPAQAAQVASIRYSPIGQTFSDRMARVFAGVPRVYGFSSVGPSGAHVEDALGHYLDSVPDYAKYIDSLSIEKISANKSFLSSLKGTPVEQIAGAPLTKEGVLPRCFLEDKNETEAKKLEWISATLLNPKTQLANLPEISDFFLKRSASSPSRFKNEEQISKLSENKVLAAHMKSVMMTDLKDFPDLQLMLVDISRYFGWMNEPEIEKMKFNLVGNVFVDGVITRTESDLLCSISGIASHFVDYSMVANMKRDGWFINTMDCLKPKDPQIQMMLVKTLLSTDDLYARGLVPQVLRFNPPTDPRVIQAIVDGVGSPDHVTREFVVETLGHMHSEDPSIDEALTRAQHDESSNVVERAGWALNERAERRKQL